MACYDAQHTERLTEFTPLEFTEEKDLACTNADTLRGLGTLELSLRYGTMAKQELLDPTYPRGPWDRSPIYQGMKDRYDMTERAK